MAFLQQGIMTDRQPSKSPQPPIAPEAQPSLFSQRSRRQLSLFFAGAGFFAVTSLITRRAIVRRYKGTIPKFYQPSNQANFEVNGGIEAAEALSIATINVLSAGMMVSGGLLWAFDISSLEDMRKYVRSRLGADGPRTDEDAEKEIEEWVAKVLHLGLKEEKRDDGSKDAEGVSEILARLSKLEEERKRTKPNDEKGK